MPAREVKVVRFPYLAHLDGDFNGRSRRQRVRPTVHDRVAAGAPALRRRGRGSLPKRRHLLPDGSARPPNRVVIYQLRAITAPAPFGLPQPHGVQCFFLRPSGSIAPAVARQFCVCVVFALEIEKCGRWIICGPFKRD